MDYGLRWAAAFALVLLGLGALALAIGDPYEGPLVIVLNAHHALSMLDLLGALLLSGASVLVWTVGLIWQRRNMASLLRLDSGRRSR